MRKSVNYLNIFKAVSILIFISLCILFLPLHISNLQASAEETTENLQLEEMINGQLDNLDLEELEKYVESLGDFSDTLE